MSEFQPIRPPEGFTLRVNDPDTQEVHEFVVCAEYDRIVHYPRIGGFLVKIVDDEEGFVQLAVNETLAYQMAEHLDTPVDVRDWCNTTEYDLIIQGKTRFMEQEFSKDLEGLDFSELDDETE